MAYLPENDPNAMTGGPVNRGGGGTFGSGGGGGSSQKPTQSGMFTNLQGYLNANQGQGGAMVDAYAKPTQADYNKAYNTTDESKVWSNMVGGLGNATDRMGQWTPTVDALNEYEKIYNSKNSLVGGINTAAENIMKPFGSSGSISESPMTASKTGGGSLLNKAVVSLDPQAKSQAKAYADKWKGVGGYLSGNYNANINNVKGIQNNIQNWNRNNPYDPNNPTLMPGW